MYDINKEKEEKYVDSFVYRSKNEANQLLKLEIYRSIEGGFRCIFFITTKRKNGYQYKKQTGKDGLKSLMWAKNCLLDFLEYAKDKYKGDIIKIFANDKKRWKTYWRSLKPLGFYIEKTRYLPICKKI